MGHPNVLVLDGGFPAWKKEGKKIETTDASVTGDDFAYKLISEKISYLDEIQNKVNGSVDF